MASAGYSGTPLARKLSLKTGQRVWWEGMPDSVRAEIEAEAIRIELLVKGVGQIEGGLFLVYSGCYLWEEI